MSERPPLRFRPDGTFTIVQFTDVHWRDGDAIDQKTGALMEAVLDAEAPDLVALTGDIVEGSEAADPAGAYRQAVAGIEARGLPWAAVFGNHDDEGKASRLDLLAAQQAGTFCLTERGPEDVTGVGNYVLPLLAADRDDLACALYFLDSNAYDQRGLGDYTWIAHDQIAWYRATSEALGREYRGAAPRLPALAFFHIPLQEYALAWDQGLCQGHRNEPVCGPALNSGFFAALVERGDVMATFCGHDHVNDFDGTLGGIRLCYGRATGYSPYGLEGYGRGARVIRLRESARVVETWVRLDDRSVEARP